MNQPTRPGCEQCGTSRPDDYVIPADAPVSDEERARIRRLEEAEKINKEVCLREFSSYLPTLFFSKTENRLATILNLMKI